MPKPQVVVLCPNVANNILNRSRVLWHLLSRDFDVTIVGPDFGKGIWPSLANEGLPLRVIPGRRPGLYRLPDELRPDLIYAQMPRWSSLAVGVVEASRLRVPLLLDCDDVVRFDKLPRPGVALDTLLYSLLIPVRSITATGPVLQRFLGAELIVPHARDAHVFDPARYDAAEARHAYGLSGVKSILFVGTPRNHKGLPEAARAVADLPDDAARLVFIDLSRDGSFTRQLDALAPGRVIGLPRVPFAEVPRLLAAADCVVLPQRPNLLARFQAPMKLFDALAMGRPIVASAVGDIPWALGQAGLLYKPGDHRALQQLLTDVLRDENLARTLSARARTRFLKHFSLEAVRPALGSLLWQSLGSSQPQTIKTLG